MALMTVNLKFVCDIGDLSVEEAVEYLSESSYFEVLEWVPSKQKPGVPDVEWTFGEYKG